MSSRNFAIRPTRHAQQLKRAIALVWRAGRGWTIASTAVLVLQGLIPLLSLYLMKLVVDSVAAGARSGDFQAAWNQVLWLVTLAGATALLAAIVGAVSAYVSEGQALAVADYMNGVVQAKAIEVDLEYYENSEYHNKLHRAQEEAPYRPRRIVLGITQLGQNTVSLLAIAGLLFSLHWGIMAVLVAAAIPGALVRLKFIEVSFETQQRHTRSERQASYLNWVLTMMFWAKEVRLFNLGPLFMERFSNLRRTLREEKIVIARRRMVQDALTQVFAIVPMFACYAYITHQTLAGAVSLGGMVMYFQAFQRGQGALQGVFNSLLGLHEDNVFLANLFEFMDLKPKVAEPSNPRPTVRPLRRGILFEHVSFQYASSSRRALHDVNLHIEPGEVVALVGENGSGKTTLVKLLCRLYDPTSGRITVDGTDIRDFNTIEYRNQISVVFQDYVKYDLTARENIWIGNLQLAANDDQVIAAARRAGADDVVRTLPYGYNTLLGNRFEEGEELSIGQWQKIALARAFVRDSQIIVLDEPTSALDPQAEHEVFDKFRQLIKDQAAILITHRLSTVKMADRICVMRDGRIVESGTHDELFRSHGEYRHLFDIQAEAYK